MITPGVRQNLDRLVYAIRRKDRPLDLKRVDAPARSVGRAARLSSHSNTPASVLMEHFTTILLPGQFGKSTHERHDLEAFAGLVFLVLII